MILQYTILAILGIISLIIGIGIVGVLKGEPMFIFKKNDSKDDEEN